ncbi:MULTISPECIES: dihydroneopterin aldolase [unclassified Rathayibacter]|uniref:dihydroneopterin aldolase n=1 Tax=unclassified Rathayibacter TaxID=2609250 RepID=UPI002B26F720|nr:MULTISPECIES: dihydroneopterin aldolase [unclassified Rathayibacter]
MTVPDPAALALRDSITLTGLRVRAHHGVFDFERENGQDFVIDATVWLDTAPAAAGDALAETVHYGELAIALADAVTRDPVDLIETLAERLATVALGFAAADVVRITVHKPDAPIPLPFVDVAVQITRASA